MGWLKHKNTFANLLATERLSIVHSNSVQTASFDLKSRVLTLPVWKEMSGDLYDMLLAHEVGHALYTPLDYVSSLQKYGQKFQNYLNPIEDIRIEKLVKRKYPGMKYQFSRSYKSLWERDFFGVKENLLSVGKSINDLALCDKIHIYGKVGGMTGITFNDAEMVYQKKAENMQTFQDALALALELMERDEQLKQQQQQQQQQDSEENQDQDGDGQGESNSKNKKKKDSKDSEKNSKKGKDKDSGDSEESDSSEGDSDSENESEENSDSSGEQGDDSEGDSGSDGSDGEGDSEEDGDSDSSDGQGDGEVQSSGSSDQQGDDEESEGGSGSASGSGVGHNAEDGGNGETDPFTFEHFSDSMNDLVDKSSKEVLFYEVPEYDSVIPKNNQDGVVVDCQVVKKELSQHYSGSRSGGYDKFKKEISPIVQFMLKEFNLKKKADEYRRTSISKTGVLDMKSLHKFKISEDIFRKATNVRDGKSHGFVVLLDWSGSMQSRIKPTVEQILIMTNFFKQAGVPFEVYAFTDGYYISNVRYISARKNPSKSVGYVRLGEERLNLLNLLSSRMNSRDYDAMCGMVYKLASANSSSNSYGRLPDGYRLGGTPLNESIVAMKQILNDFRKQTKVEVLNAIIMTDGEGGSVNLERHPNSSGYYSYSNNILVDGVTQFGDATETSSLLNWLKYKTNANIIGFFLSDSFGHPWASYGKRDEKGKVYGKGTDVYEKSMAKFKAEGFVSGKSEGYDEHYIIKMNSVSDIGTFNNAIRNLQTAEDISDAFVTSTVEKKKARTLAQHFVTKICENLS